MAATLNKAPKMNVDYVRGRRWTREGPLRCDFYLNGYIKVISQITKLKQSLSQY